MLFEPLLVECLGISLVLHLREEPALESPLLDQRLLHLESLVEDAHFLANLLTEGRNHLQLSAGFMIGGVKCDEVFFPEGYFEVVDIGCFKGYGILVNRLEFISQKVLIFVDDRF